MSTPPPPVPGPGSPRSADPQRRVQEARERLAELEADPQASPAEVAAALEEVRDLLRAGLSESGTG